MSHPALAAVDPRLYLVTDTAQCAAAGRSVAHTAAEAVVGGAGIVQVRDKQASDAEFTDLVHAVLIALRSVEAPALLVVNDRLDVVRELRAQGHDVHLHLGQDDVRAEDARRVLGPEVVLGISAATEIEIARAASAGADLVGIGPVWQTTTKADAGAGLGIGRLLELAAAATVPAFAIGGIDVERARVVRAADTADALAGICVVSAICGSDDPRAAATALLTTGTES